VLLGPENPAGVAAALRDGLRERGHAAELAMLRAHPFGLPHDRVAAGMAARLREGVLAPLRHDVLHWQFGTTFLEHLDAAWARVAGRPLQLMHYWGDDARTVQMAERFGAPHAEGLRLDAGQGHDRLVTRRLRHASRLCRAALVSDLELLRYVEPWFARIYVVPTPLGRLAPAPPPPPLPLPGTAPIVVHAPSNPRTKGTAVIGPLLERLGADGVLRPRVISGVLREEILAEVARADVIVDQLHSQTPGVFALEAMALGKPVLVEFRRELLAGPMRDAPLVAVTPATLERELRALCADRERRLVLGHEGRAYVERVHGAAHVAAAVEHVYGHSPRAPPGRYLASPAGVTTLPG
jgi:hypothetical protein